MNLVTALAVLLKAIPYLDKWADRFLVWFKDWQERRAAKKLDKALEHKKKENDSSKLEDLINGK